MNVQNYTWVEFDQDVDTFLKQVDFSNYDTLIGLGKGGFPLLTKLANRAKKNYYTIPCSSYDGREQKYLTLNLFGVLSVTGARVLLIDDIADSGNTLEAASNELYQRGAFSVDSMTLFYKPQSKVLPHWFLHEVPNEQWIEFCWE